MLGLYEGFDEGRELGDNDVEGLKVGDNDFEGGALGL